MWLLDNLLDDGRFEEAAETIEGFARINDTCRVPYYRGLLLWYQGRRAEAHKIWDKMKEDYADDWGCWASMGDVAAMETSYDEAIANYRKCIEAQPSPKYVDGFASIAQVLEIKGDHAAAISALEE